MEKSKAKSKRPIKLRKRAEELLNQNSAVIKKIPPMDVRNLIEDLQIYQIELEKYNIELQKAHENLQESEKRFKNITNSIKELFVFLDQNFKIQLINSTLAQAYNISLDEYAGKHCYELFYGRNDICEGCPAIKVLNEGEVTRGALRYRPDGRIYDRTAYPFIADNGNITGVIVIGSDITRQKQVEEELRESEEKYRSMMEAMVEPAYICTSDFIVSYMNPAMVKRTGRDATGELCYKAINDLDEQCPWCVHDRIQNGENDEIIIVSPKDHRPYSISRAPIFHNDSSISQMTIYRDITDIKQTEQRLKQREKELEIKNIRLEEMNAALKILLGKRDEDKKELEEKVMTNIKELVLPYVTKLKNTGLNDRQEIFADIIQSNIEAIISPFSRRLSFKYLNLTPSELQVANLVKQGKSTKEIAELFNLSAKTIESYRKNIRSKLGISNKKINLRTHLLSIQ